LRHRSSRARKNVIGDRDVNNFGYRARQHCRLVEASLPQPRPVKRYRHESVRIRKQFGARSRHPAAERSCQVEAIAVFQEMGEIACNVAVPRRGTCPVECGW
jgi:hypothetical protein